MLTNLVTPWWELQEELRAKRLKTSASMTLSSLANLSISGLAREHTYHIHQKWIAACGTRPDFKRWRRLGGADKRHLLHTVAAEADDDTSEEGSYLTAYFQTDIDEVLARGIWSVEHVVPRSKVNGSVAGDAEDDPVGWIEATRLANSARSNFPLMLWRDPDGQLAPSGTLVTIDSEKHFVPPLEQRARLARKWMFVRATYPGEVAPPSEAQRARAADIVSLAKHWPVGPAEARVNEIHRRERGWANPLLEKSAERWLDDVHWRALVFGLV